MQRWFTAGKLEDLDAALAIDHALNAALQIRERDGIDVLARANGRIRVAGWAGEVARVDDFDERETGGELFEWGVSFSDRVPAESSADGAIAGPAGVPAAIAGFGIFRSTLGEPIKPRV